MVIKKLNSVGDKSMLWSKNMIESTTGGNSASNDETVEDEERFLAVIFIIRSDFNCFGDLAKDLLRDDIQGTGKHPTTVAKSYELLQDYESNGLTSNKSNHNKGGSGDNSNNGGINSNNGAPCVSFV